MREFSISLVVCLVVMAIPAGAGAQSLPSDPESDSPSGAVYEIPVDRARKDAAPRQDSSQQSDSGPTEGSGDAGEGDTSIRSENNFGTSSSVPGAESEEGAKRRDGAAGSDRNDGVGGAVESVGEIAGRPAARAGEGPSEGVVFSLVGVLLAVGGVIGVVAARRHGRGRT
jgi:hypothetical protein